MNAHIHSAHSHSPFETLYGYTPEFTIPNGIETKYPSIERRMELLQHAHEDAEAALRMSKECIREGVKGKVQEFEVGQPVWLSLSKLKVQQKNQKILITPTHLDENPQ
ncbi:hypothetical protein J3R30DRAFT_3452364, partial [Lentinula aciculospora]